MTDKTIFLGFYFLGALVYWFSYILLRPYIKRSNKHLFLFFANLFLGLFLVGYLPAYLYLTKQMDHSIVLFLAITMSLSGLFHHLGFLKDIQPWRGIITPKEEKVPLIHGAVSHLLFSISYIVYGFLLLYYFSFENFVIYPFVFWVELVGFLVLFDGLRMCYPKKR